VTIDKSLLGTNKLSAFVANKLSGYYDSQKGDKEIAAVKISKKN